jgi:hypothetical protein
MRAFVCLALLVLAGNQFAAAAEMRSVEVQHEGGRYSVVSVVWFDAGIDETFEVFKTWDYSTQFSSAIVDAQDLDPDSSGRPGYYIVNRGCVLFFCKSMVRQGYVEMQHNRDLRAVANPQVSDFRLFEEDWKFVEESGGTRVRYELLMEPAFWVPPAIGPYLIKRKLRNKGGDALDRIEGLAQRLGDR